MSAARVPWKPVKGGLMVTVRATPRSARDAIEGVERLADDSVALKVRVRAAPAEGEANAALMHLLARAATVAPSAVSIKRGGSGRVKQLHIAGDAASVAASLAAAVHEGARERK